ncbi:MAG: PAS domain S-box protein [Chloroflexi bacterium]|nr:PAS domain S-box protein [Chloroflexota bacterium]
MDDGQLELHTVQNQEITGLEAERTLTLVTECADIMFEYAPVMMHSINEEGVLVKVNQHWLATMGYELDEVLGRKSIDFLTEESRSQAVSDTLPLFWQAGRAHSIGCELVRKDGRVFDVLLDAYMIEQPQGDRTTLATLSERRHVSQRPVASSVLRVLLGLNRAQHILYEFLPPTTTDEPVHQTPEVEPVSPASPRIAKAGDWDQLSHIAQEVSSHLHAMADVKEQRMHSMANQRQQLLLLAETVETTLAKLTMDAAKTSGQD